jgi:hypothetical protein
MRFTLVFILLSSIISLKGQQSYTDAVYYTNHIFNDKIKSVQLYQERWNLSYPILKLNSVEKMVLHFDLLDDQAEAYSYTFIH